MGRYLLPFFLRDLRVAVVNLLLVAAQAAMRFLRFFAAIKLDAGQHASPNRQFPPRLKPADICARPYMQHH